MNPDDKNNDDMRELLASTLNLNDDDVRALLKATPTPGAEDIRLQCVREMSISVLQTLAEWVADEGDTHGGKVLETALQRLTAGDALGRRLAPQVSTCEQCRERVFTGNRCRELPACPACGGRMMRPT